MSNSHKVDFQDINSKSKRITIIKKRSRELFVDIKIEQTFNFLVPRSTSTNKKQWR